jgi:hypothetical protein
VTSKSASRRTRLAAPAGFPRGRVTPRFVLARGETRRFAAGFFRRTAAFFRTGFAPRFVFFGRLDRTFETGFFAGLLVFFRAVFFLAMEGV